MWHTLFHKASWRSLMRLKPVVKMFPSAKKMALIGRAPSWALSFSCREGDTHTDRETDSQCWSDGGHPPKPDAHGKTVVHAKHGSSKSPTAKFPRRTATTFLLRGSMTRTFLSLQAVQSRAPLRLQLTLKITSGCMSSRLIMASPVPTFQMMIWLSQPKKRTQAVDGGPQVYFWLFLTDNATEASGWDNRSDLEFSCVQQMTNSKL